MNTLLSIISNIDFQGEENNLIQTDYRVHFNPENKTITAHIICKNQYGSAYDCGQSGTISITEEQILDLPSELTNNPN